MWRLIRVFVDGDEGFAPNGPAARWPGGRRRGRVFADFVAHLFRDVIKGLWQRFAALERLYATVKEADPAEEQVRIVAERHDGDDDNADCCWGRRSTALHQGGVS